jgi:Ca2+-transporting ATPase
MNQPPRSPLEPIVRLMDVARIVIVGAVMAAGGLWVYFEGTGGNPQTSTAAGRTAAFTVFAVAPLLYAFAKRSDHLHFWQSGLLTNRMLLAAVGIGVGLQAVAVLVPGAATLFKTGPMDGNLWISVLLASALPFVMVELLKLAGMGRRTVVEIPVEQRVPPPEI